MEYLGNNLKSNVFIYLNLYCESNLIAIKYESILKGISPGFELPQRLLLSPIMIGFIFLLLFHRQLIIAHLVVASVTIGDYVAFGEIQYSSTPPPGGVGVITY